MTDVYIRPAKWGKWQDCRFKNADWIKNWTALLDDIDYQDLTLNQRAVLHGLWMAWGSLGRPLPRSCPSLARLLVCDCNALGKALPVLISNGFIELCDRTSPLSDKRIVAISPPETETETETEEPPLVPPSAKAKGKPAKRAFRVADDWLPADDDIQALLAEGFSSEAIMAEKTKFVDWCIANGKTYAEPGRAFRGWVRRSATFAGEGNASDDYDWKKDPAYVGVL